MIERYTRPEMERIWTLENKYRKWLDVELAVCEVLFERGAIPPEDFKAIREKAGFNVDRIEEIERETQHDVIAFLTNVAEFVGPSSRFIHEGLTSSDVLDTSFGLLLTEASDLLLDDIDKLLSVLKKRAFEFKDTVQIGRSHNIHAEPITFGLKLAVWYSEMERNRERLLSARESIRVGKISGAVGTFANIAPEIEEAVCARLGLKPAPVSTQIVQRDRHAQFFSTLAIAGCSIEKIATQFRLLQHTEIREVEEYFAPSQKGSSAMPHKRNPISSENLSGLGARAQGQCHGRNGKRCTVARKRYQPLIGRACYRSGFHNPARLHAGASHKGCRPADGTSGQHETQHVRFRKPFLFSAGAAFPYSQGNNQRRGISHSTAKRDGGLGQGRRHEGST